MSYTIHTTKQLFYNKYVYKIILTALTAQGFRFSDTGFDLFLASPNKFTPETCKYSQQLRAFLNHHQSEVKLRIEYTYISIYTNNYDIIEELISMSGDCIDSLYVPKTDKIKDFLLVNPDTIVIAKPTFKYKIHLKHYYPEFDQWAKPLGNRVKSNTSTVYVNSEKILNMCQLFLGSKIRKVEKYVAIRDIL